MDPNANWDFVAKKDIICQITIPSSAVTTYYTCTRKNVESKSALVDMLDIFGCPLFLIGTIMKTCALHATRSTSTTFCASCSCLVWQRFSGIGCPRQSEWTPPRPDLTPCDLLFVDEPKMMSTHQSQEHMMSSNNKREIICRCASRTFKEKQWAFIFQVAEVCAKWRSLCWNMILSDYV